MIRYQVVWPMVGSIRTSSSGVGGVGLMAASAYAGHLLPADVLPEEIDRLLAEGAIKQVEFVDEAA